MLLFILFGGCIIYTKNAISKIRREAETEKLELERRLIQNPHLNGDSALATTCSVCLDQPREILFLPCNHFCVCKECRAILKKGNNKCPICRKNVKQTIKAYL